MGRQVEPAAMENFSRGLAERSELKFVACLPADLAGAVVALRSLDEVNLDCLGARVPGHKTPGSVPGAGLAAGTGNIALTNKANP